MKKKITPTLQGSRLSCDWPAATYVYVSPFQWKTISLTSTIVVTISPPALLNKVSPSFSFETAICAQRCEKNNCSCNWYLFSSQSVGKLFHTVTLNKLSDSFWCRCYLKTSLLLHLQNTHSGFVQLSLAFLLLEKQHLAVHRLSPFSAMYSKLMLITVLLSKRATNNCFSLGVKCLLKQRAFSFNLPQDAIKNWKYNKFVLNSNADITTSFQWAEILKSTESGLGKSFPIHFQWEKMRITFFAVPT